MSWLPDGFDYEQQRPDSAHLVFNEADAAALRVRHGGVRCVRQHPSGIISIHVWGSPVPSFEGDVTVERTESHQADGITQSAAWAKVGSCDLIAVAEGVSESELLRVVQGIRVHPTDSAR